MYITYRRCCPPLLLLLLLFCVSHLVLCLLTHPARAAIDRLSPKMLPYVLGAFLLSALSVSANSQHSCFKRRLDHIAVADNFGYVQCNNTQHSDGGAQLCCKKGDRCGDDSICHTDDIASGLSSWYVGGCSDGSYEDPVCRKDCSKLITLQLRVRDVVLMGV